MTTPHYSEYTEKELEELRKTDKVLFTRLANQYLREHGNTPSWFEARPTIDAIFHKNLPSTLYMDHYSLAQSYGYTPQEWRTFLRDNALFIETELAAIAEAEARSALARLGNASGQEVQALKAILEKSKLINDAQKQSTKIVLTFIPNATEKKEEKPIENQRNHDYERLYEPRQYPDREEQRLWELRGGTV